MGGISRFRHNAGMFGVVQTAIVTFFVSIGVLHSIQAGRWHLSLPLCLAGVVLAHALRNLMVAHLDATRRIMTVVWFGGMIYLVSRPSMTAPMCAWANMVTLFAISLYMGCYFFMFSDPRVFVVRKQR